jgi:hypothetical protein
VRVVEPRTESWLPRAALHAFIASAVVYTGFHIVDLAPPYPLILAVCAGGVMVRRAVALTAESRFYTRDIVRPPRRARFMGAGGWYQIDDGMVEAVRRWDRRLEWGATAPERFGHTMTGRLGELVDERLRQRHGFTRASDPERARALIGEEGWRVLGAPTDRVPSPRDVYFLVQRMESL